MHTCECGFSCLSKNMARHKVQCQARVFAMQVCELKLQIMEKDRQMMSRDALLSRQIEEREKIIAQKDLEIHHLRMEKQLAEQESENNRLRCRPTTININNQVNIIAFGDEPIPSTVDVSKILSPPDKSVSKYIELKHFRDPRTSNFRIRNKRSKTIQVWRPDVNERLRWTELDRRETIENIVDNNLVELTEKHGASRVAQWRRWYQSSGLEEIGYNKTSTYKRILQDVEYLLVTQMNGDSI